MRRFLPFAALLGVAFVLGCQDLGTGVVASDGLVPQFSKKDCGADSSHPGCKGEADGGGHHFVFVDVKLTGWMITTPVDDRNQMELARKPGIMKIRTNNEKAGTKFLHFAIDMDNTAEYPDRKRCGL